jgi:hypothetical protein
MRSSGITTSIALVSACAALSAGSALSGCSAGREAIWEKDKVEATKTSSAAASPLMAEADEHWKKRDDKAELEMAIQKWEKAIESDPGNADAMVRLARACYFLADGYLALDKSVDQEVELAVYTKGVDYGERALAKLEPDFEAAMRGGASFEEAITEIGENGLPAAYWYAVNLGRFATKKGLSVRLYYKDKLKATMETILKRDPKFFYGAADRYFGAFYSVLPSIAGKDLDKSKAHFEASMNLAPEYLTTRVVKAQFLAVELDDEAMYKALLDEVLKGSDTDNPDIAPENRAAKRTAEKMLADIDEVF